MRALASFAMRNRSAAIMITTVSAMLAMILPPVAYLGSATVALATLRHGPREGIWVIVGAFVAVSVLGLLILQNPLPGFFFALGLWLPLWLVSWTLRETVSLALALELAAALALLLLLSMYVVMGDPGTVWRDTLGTVIGPALEQAGVSQGSMEMQGMLERLARLMNGLFAASFALSVVVSLLLGRWWQGMLYNPGGFRREFHTLRLHRTVAPLAVGAVVLALLASGGLGQFMTDVSLTLSILYLFQGLAVVHGLVGQTGASVGWLVGMYTLLAIALPQIAALLALIGVLDAPLDLRARLPKRPT